MGGTAIKCSTIRVNKHTYDRISEDVRLSIAIHLNRQCHEVASYRMKNDYGDVDILVAGTSTDALIEFIEQVYTESAHTVSKNNNVVSFGYKTDNGWFQIDLIAVNQYWEAAQTFYDYDPTGNLMGKLAHKFGLKYGFNGLVLPIRTHAGRLAKNIVLTTDQQRIFEVLGYDYQRYRKGFDTLDEIFEFITSSENFNPAWYHPENMTARDRTRNKRRKTFHAFVEYCTQYETTGARKLTFDETLMFCEKHFPEQMILTKYQLFKIRDDKLKRVAQKFNGHTVMSAYPELKGKSMSPVIAMFKDSFTDEAWYDFCDDNDIDTIMQRFDEVYNEYKSKKL